jgi:hypothetical protein
MLERASLFCGKRISNPCNGIGAIPVPQTHVYARKSFVAVVVVVNATLLVWATTLGHRENPSCWEEEPYALFGSAQA